MSFSLDAVDPATGARAGRLKTRRGVVETPVFMPVATMASVKALSQEDLAALGAQILLANSYHLYLRPGCSVIEKAGGLGAFMGYPGAVLTDSGGFQVMSLCDLRELTEEGAVFKSHLDGSLHKLTPESVIGVQRRLGSDLWTSLDECPRWPCDEAAARAATERTMRWTERAHAEVLRCRAQPCGAAQGGAPLFFPIIQGCVYPALRRLAAEGLSGLSFDGVCIGGMSVGEPKPLLWDTLAATTEFLPTRKPRYLMGVGAPEDLWEAVGRGADMLDCVWPTRVARNGLAMVRDGRLNLVNARYREDFAPLDPGCACFVCARYSRAYLRHLLQARELSVYRLVSYHNVHFLITLMREIRSAILAGRFSQARAAFLDRHRAGAIESHAA